MTWMFPVLAGSYSFDPTLLTESENKADFSLFEQGGQLPGTYLVDIILGGEKVDSTNVAFHSVKSPTGEYSLQSCLTKEQLSRYGVDVDNYPELLPPAKNTAQGEQADQCVNLAAIPQASEEFEFYNMQLVLNIPQVALRPKDEIPIERWDDGVTAFLLNYMANSSETTYRQNGQQQRSHYIQLYPGFNIGAWRIRNATSWSQSGDTGGKWQSSYIYATRGLYRLKSRITLGESYTPGDFFDSVPFTGVMLGDDANMLPSNQRDFMPVVRGIARSQARVEVRQNGYLIYSTVVSPGPFELTDMLPSHSEGDLHVTVLESNGATQQFTVPYTVPAIALRKGRLRYNLMAGRYRPANVDVETTPIAQATVAYGLPWNLAAFVGGQWSPHYQATTAGMGVMLGDYGALSSSITQASSEYRQQQPVKGQVWEVRYNKTLQASDTSFSVVNSQYSTADFSTLSDVLQSYRRHGDSCRDWHSNPRRNQTSVVVGQSLGQFGYLNLNWSRQNYRDAPASSSWGIQYSFNTGDLNWSLDWIQNQYRGNQDRLLSLSVSMPLGRERDTYAAYRMTSSDNSKDHELSLYGHAFDNRLSWNVRQTERYAQFHSGENSGSLGLDWHGSYGDIGGNYYYNPTMRQISANVSGGAVIHRHGLTLGPQINGTAALVEVPGVSGVSTSEDHRLKTDFRGYSIVPSLFPYQEHDISLETTDLPPDAEVTNTDAKVLPTEGAIVRASFSPQIGARALMTIKRANGETIPFGAMASLVNQPANAAIVDEGGKAYLTGLPETGQLLVQWGKDASQQCRVDYQLATAKKGDAGLYMLSGVCH
ncbi:TPA: fimbrial biogenesis outer membrane usher protein [Yersinia enterocolitica]|uniref:fimbrial polyadhesin usher MyfC n=1 Tax=Yersinia enterocolitica TaxID=630 RepID=UPI003235D251|nr:fimbrial biogenesis outer membrane usher protein [Yersinia enterocolitica]HDL7178013.1 fimbrial biogenesis outer membrane usher protein [Yersinia enterocolitica]HDL7318200.1 fimbrial biogenesis outer membrane usher protein [Yersinia enterocolitica]HDL7408872.1 fimbrial biogenesis outer membrane usher protein [Yersinia enterocolitica]HDL7446574.1 fimbrial biogenesis outer membrane usher protein [Yersinia enterocolitica]